MEVRTQVGMADATCVGLPAAAAAGSPSHVPSGAALLAVLLSEEARGISGLDVLRRSVDRAPPASV